jgi:FHS family glucose/mannose:H+ symporter-like MFS transporter
MADDPSTAPAGAERSGPALRSRGLRLSRLTWSLAAVFLCYGSLVFAFGPCLTSMAETFSVPVGRLGLIFSLYAVGLIPSVLLNGYLSEIMGRRLIVLGIVALAAISSALFGLVAMSDGPHAFAYALVVMVLMGYAGGGIEAVVNVVIADDNQPAPGFALNIIHAFFAAGAVLSPLAVSALLRAHLPWPFVFFGNAALLVAAFLLLLPERMPAATAGPFPLSAALTVARSRLVWLLFAVIACYVGAELGVSAWVSPLMEEVLHTPRDAAALSVSVFWALMIVGRVGVSPLSLRFRPPPMLFVLALGSAACSLAVARANSAAACFVAAGAAGLFMSGIFALVLADASRHYPQRLGAVYGIITAGVGVGSLIVPAVMGALIGAAGLRAAMLVPVGLLAAVTLVYAARWSQ